MDEKEYPPREQKDKFSPPGQKGKVTVIIVNFNAGSLLSHAVSSVLASPLVSDVVVSDNGSRDQSLKQLPSDPRLLVIENSRNLGFSAANNRALTVNSTSPYLLLLNPDTSATPEAINAMTDFMDSNPDAGMCGPRILNDNGSEQRACRRDEPRPMAALQTLLGQRERGINKASEPLPDGPIEVDAISGACMFVRREALEEVGPLDEGYFLHCEDLDWCKRFWLKGWKVMFLPHVTITHVKGGSSRKRQLRVEWHKHKGMARYYRKFYRDRYPRPLMYLVYAGIWTRFALMAPVWLWRSRFG